MEDGVVSEAHTLPLGVAGRAGAPEVEHAPPRGLFALFLFFLLIEYARVPGIILLKPQFVILLILPLAWASARERPWSPILTLQVGFLAWCAMGVALSSNNYMAYFTTRAMYGHVVIAITITWLLADLARFRTTIWWWLAIMTYGAVYALLHSGHGPGTPVGDENETAMAFGVSLGLALFGFEYMKGASRWLCAGLAMLFISAVITTYSRGGFVGIAAVVVFAFFLSRRKLRALAAVALGIVAFLVLAPSEYLDEVKSIQKTDEGTAKTRQFLWRSAFNMWLDYPIKGVGGWNFNYKVQQYIPQDFEVASDRQWRHYYTRNWGGKTVHSLYFQMLAEQGAGGVLLFAGIVLLHFRTLWRLRRHVRDKPLAGPGLRRDVEMYTGGLAAAMVAYLTAGAFVSVAYYPYPWYLSGLAVAFDLGVRRELARHQAAAGRAELSDLEPDASSAAGVSHSRAGA